MYWSTYMLWPYNTRTKDNSKTGTLENLTPLYKPLSKAPSTNPQRTRSVSLLSEGWGRLRLFMHKYHVQPSLLCEAQHVFCMKG